MTTPTPRRHHRPLVAVAVVSLIAALLSIVAPASGLEAVPGGPVVLDGNDPDDHYPSISTYMQDVYTNLDSNLAPGYVHNDEVAVVGTCAASLESRTTIAETFVTFDDAAEVESLFLNIGSNNYKILHICSDDDSSLSIDVENELDKWGSAIAAHVNRGGGLFSTGHSYNWLGDLFPSLTVTNGGTSSSFVTADGATFFATLTENTQVSAINHYTFSDVDTTTLLPLLSESTGGAGRLVAIGGSTVRFPQISFTGPSTGEVGSTESFTLVAADADGTPLSNNSFDYTISGVTDDAASGSAVTDASGEYTFDITGNAKGSTTITVQMTLGTGESAGSAITTTWATLPSAPTITSAVDVGGASNRVLVSWNAGDDGGKALTDYVIEYQIGGGSWTTFDDGTGVATSATVTGLPDGTAVTFRVAAVNPLGQSPWSTTEVGTSVGSPSAPTWVGSVPGDTEFDLEWNAPASDNGSAVTHYVVEYSVSDADTWTAVAPNPTTLDTTVTGVLNATDYDVRVAAVNAEGQGAWSEILVATALTVPDAVEGLRALPGDGEITIEWASPDFDGGSPVIGFAVTGVDVADPLCVPEHWHPEGDHDAHWWRCTITGLTNDVEVGYQVAAQNAQGTGEGTAILATPVAPVIPEPLPAADRDPVAPTGIGECGVPSGGFDPLGPAFTDSMRAYQLDPVTWAQENGLVRGTSPGTFDGDELIPRWQLGILLWRAFGSPDTETDQAFIDVNGLMPLDWAGGLRYFVGVGGGAFDPDRAATRAEWITVLWRATCEPVIDTPNPFTDLEADWYRDAVHWGVSAGVTKGRTDTEFDPNAPITRGEAVVMLVRWIKSFD